MLSVTLITDVFFFSFFTTIACSTCAHFLPLGICLEQICESLLEFADLKTHSPDSFAVFLLQAVILLSGMCPKTVTS